MLVMFATFGSYRWFCLLFRPAKIDFGNTVIFNFPFDFYSSFHFHFVYLYY